MTTFGIDISRHQVGINLDTVFRDPGFDFMVAKLSEGATWSDPEFHRYRLAAERNEVLFAGYHFLRGDSHPRAQAMNALASLEGNQVPVIIDLERTNGSTQPDLEVAEEFYQAAHLLGLDVVPLIYFPEWYWNEIGSPNATGWRIWQSDYGNNDGAYPGDGSPRWDWGYRVADLLQFTSAGRVPGYPGDVDLNAYKGTREELAATGWFVDYKKDTMTLEEIQRAVATTPINIGRKETMPLQKVLRLLLNKRTPEQIAAAVVAALPVPADEDEQITSADVEQAVAKVLREGTDSIE